MDGFTVQHYIRRASDFLKAMQLVSADVSYANASALLAIHSAISYSDALRVGLGDGKVGADDHRAAVEGLERLLNQKRYEDRSGLGQLKSLLSKKSLVAYGAGNLRYTDFQDLVVKESLHKFCIHSLID